MDLETVAAGKYEQIGGFETHYHEAGQGENILLIHGSGLGVSAWANWRNLFPLLAPDYHVFALDLVGFGHSEKPKIDYSIDHWINHVIDFIETKMQPPVYIVGNSLGGAISLHISRKRPDLVRSQIIMGAPGLTFDMTEGLEIAWGAEPGFENMRKMISAFSYDQSLAQNDDLIQLRHEASIAPGVPEAFSSMFPEPRQPHLDKIALSEKALTEIETPTLLLHGREDYVVPVEKSWEMAQLIPNCELHTFPKCGHWIQIEKSVEFTKQVTSFIEKT